MAVLKYSIIIPVYKNEGSIPRLVKVLRDMNRKLSGQLEAVFVVDGSPDDSLTHLHKALKGSNLTSQVIVHSRSFGSFSAIRTGLDAATGQKFAVMAADLQEPPELVLAIFQSLDRDECDVALGVRTSRSDPFLSRLASRMYWSLYRRFVVSDIPPGGVDIFGCNEPFRLELLKLKEARSSLVALIFWLGFRRKFIYYERLQRAEGKSSWTLKKKIEYMLDSMFAFTDLPIKILLTIGTIGMLISSVLAVVVIVGRLAGWISVPGYTALMLVMLFFGSLNIFGFGIIGSYVWRAYENLKGRPLSVISEHYYYFGDITDSKTKEQRYDHALLDNVLDNVEEGEEMTQREVFVHPNAICESLNLGKGTRIWAFAHILPGARIGCECNICDHVFIENDVIVGNRVTIKSGVQLWDGIRIADDVFIGPNATFTNDRFPRSKQYPPRFLETKVEKGASIGGGAVILPGIVIGAGAMIGAGAVVTRAVPSNAIVVGNPARIVGYVGDIAIKQIGDVDTNSAAGGRIHIGVGQVQLEKLPKFVDIRGSLSVGSFMDHVPFIPKRYFLVYDVPSKETRGEHAHKECHQFLVCVHGSVSVLVDDGVSRAEVCLDSPTLGLYVPPMIWVVQYKYSQDAVLLVFASHEYDPGDYIRNYEQFVELANAHNV